MEDVAGGGVGKPAPPEEEGAREAGIFGCC